MIIGVIAALIHALMHSAILARVVNMFGTCRGGLSEVGQFRRCARAWNKNGRTIICRANHPAMRNRPLHAGGERCEQEEQAVETARVHGCVIYFKDLQAHQPLTETRVRDHLFPSFVLLAQASSCANDRFQAFTLDARMTEIGAQSRHWSERPQLGRFQTVCIWRSEFLKRNVWK